MDVGGGLQTEERAGSVGARLLWVSCSGGPGVTCFPRLWLLSENRWAERPRGSLQVQERAEGAWARWTRQRAGARTLAEFWAQS